MGKDGQPLPPEERTLPLPVGRLGDELVFYVNGINTDLEKQMDDMERIAAHGKQVIGIHNATAGQIWDLAECVTDKLNVGKNPAVTTVKNMLKICHDTGTRLTLVGHSQGALVCSRALWELKNEALEQGLTEDWFATQYADVHVETAGGAAYTYPKGPSYHHKVNQYDLVPMLAGVGSGLPGTDTGTDEPVETFQRIQAPYRKETDSNYDIMMNFVDRTVHGTEVYYRKVSDIKEPQGS
jgi:hypothetical protein